ncbi:MAG: hypothetical protein HYY19_09285 [Candidatus Rokubacteria bacterium]|nr:hypothetical protein [Candidatus Rokubacteria bacterium]
MKRREAPAPRARSALEGGLRDRGWQPGENVRFEHRFADSQSDIPRLAASLVAARVDVIVASTPLVIAAAGSATTEIPIFVTLRYGGLIAMLALMHRLPALFGCRDSVEAGGLASYGPGLFATQRHAASFVDRILRGARAGDLPIERPPPQGVHVAYPRGRP